MIVKCELCGGENRVHPGQKMLKCSYCGSALLVDDSNYPEHLILPHKRNDKAVEDILRSFLLKRNMGRPRKIEIKFCFVPYTMIEDENGKSSGYPAKGAPLTASPIPDPPAGVKRKNRGLPRPYAQNPVLEGVRMAPQMSFLGVEITPPGARRRISIWIRGAGQA